MSEKQEAPACGRCRFFVLRPGAQECHRYAPRPQFDGRGSELRSVEWPGVEVDEWCGEHEPRDTEGT